MFFSSKKLIISLVLCITTILLSSCGKTTSNTKTKTINNTTTYDSEYFDLKKYEGRDILKVFIERLNTLDNYKKETNGETVAKSIIKYTQKINAIYEQYKDDRHFISKSSSLIKNTYHEAYFLKDSINQKEKEDDELSSISYEDYLNDYGFLPYEPYIEGFVITDESIISFDLIENNTYKLEVDGEKCGSKIKTQMKKEGELSDYPTFSKVSFEITITDEFLPVEIKYHAEYTISIAILGNMSCVCDYSVTYTYLT